MNKLKLSILIFLAFISSCKNDFTKKEKTDKYGYHEITNAAYVLYQNKGYRANGDRHPHSWAIVDKKDLINWMLSE